MEMKDFTIKLMELDDIAASVKVLSVAMLKNPIHIAVLKGHGEQQRAKIENMFLNLFTTFPGISFVAMADKKIVGVMRMKSCFGPSGQDLPEKLEKEETIDGRIAFWNREWARNDPARQHWHLGPIGVLPSHRRLGIGTAFMELFCREVDKCRTTAFLETDSDKNVIFYRKFGFEIVSTSHIFGTESIYMTRAVRIDN